ncbi:antibiotic ABC transporter ATP-binding protein [Flavobacterium branchiophilum NBRC 15030 = ATCC 35035]|uniref:Subfamily B ATP-binding cassette protein MsbA n=1 Tax=Flavobacterium branchiophilum TaxID=55197 RepID=A0A543G5R4_9FLAO|nr:ABC transporter ATP-binding protein [Flavobacterium branchiophilum]OXA74821.1 antibiotic ABC transporter ATP-binding protein [Flavobacterium branchiophilum NBRC 15030 = ATCC 35035]TQM41364.1 subfamily B ATP-binding cassette protein MsbA [Flavobacterium branchiophilum]GEM55006.1 antibiotic ABC transporter ATP-binding protein [Flavobacterium branchiophilum NBRC 15030 = ATCC 35035]
MDENLKKIIPFVKPYQFHVVWNVIFNILYALFSTLSFIALIPMLDVLFKNENKVITKPVLNSIWDITSFGKQYLYYQINSLSKTNGPEMALILVVSLVIVTFLLKNLFNYLASNHLMHLKNGVLKDLRNLMYNKIIELPISYYSEKRKGDIMARMLGDVGEVQNSFFAILELIVKEPMTIVFTIATMFAISAKLTLFVFIFIPISGYIISKIGKTLKSKSQNIQTEGGYLISIVEETLSGLKVVKSYNAENKFKEKFHNSTQKLLSLSNNIGRKNNLASPFSEFMGIIVIAILLWYGGNMVLIEKLANGKPVLEGAQFLAYMGLAYNILTPAKSISKASYAVKSGMAAAQRVFEVLEVENEITNKENALDKKTFENNISLNNINFKYQNDNVLENFSLTIPKGKTVALVGQSGSGKSTIASLLTRFYDVQKGQICIDGIDIKDLKMHDLRGLIGLVTQKSILFNDTIKNNLLIGKNDATDAEIIEALTIANAYEFVRDLPKGIETNIGDAGDMLSGGQQQRLAIARAVLKNPPIMILDEATSALDTESEKHVQIALENMMQNRTSVVIAHRLSTIQKADLIVVMQKGKIVEQGKHDELIQQNGVYKKLVMMQSFDV